MIPLEVAGSVSGKVGSLASRCANSQASALNAGVSTVPYSPESNCSYLPIFDQSRSCTPCEPPAQSSKRLVLT